VVCLCPALIESCSRSIGKPILPPILHESDMVIAPPMVFFTLLLLFGSQFVMGLPTMNRYVVSAGFELLSKLHWLLPQGVHCVRSLLRFEIDGGGALPVDEAPDAVDDCAAAEAELGDDVVVVGVHCW